jgi:hypothetical protein
MLYLRIVEAQARLSPIKQIRSIVRMGNVNLRVQQVGAIGARISSFRLALGKTISLPCSKMTEACSCLQDLQLKSH